MPNSNRNGRRVEPRDVTNALLRHSNPLPMIKAAHRLVTPLVWLRSPELLDLAIALIGDREFRTVYDIEQFQQEFGVEAGYLPIEPRRGYPAGHYDSVVSGYWARCFAQHQVSVVAECIPSAVTLMIDTTTRPEYFSDAEQEAIDLMLPPGTRVHHWIDLPDRARRHRVDIQRGHEFATRLLAILRPER